MSALRIFLRTWLGCR